MSLKGPQELTMAGSQGLCLPPHSPSSRKALLRGAHGAPKGRPHTPGGQGSEDLGVLGTTS